jgi:hypothetical protein
VALRVHRATGAANWGKDGKPANPSRVSTGSEGWLLAERPVPGEEGERKYYYSNLPAATPLERLAALAHARWPIEQFYEEAKGECGLDDYQGRRWDGLQRHLALVTLTYSFLMVHRHATSAAGGFSPLSPTVVPGDAPPGADLGVPRSRPLADRDRSPQTLSPSTKLTK